MKKTTAETIAKVIAKEVAKALYKKDTSLNVGKYIEDNHNRYKAAVKVIKRAADGDDYDITEDMKFYVVGSEDVKHLYIKNDEGLRLNLHESSERYKAVDCLFSTLDDLGFVKAFANHTDKIYEDDTVYDIIDFVFKQDKSEN